MRCAILSDIHANMAALMAVLADFKRRGEVDAIWCLGDIVGMGPDPHECIQLLRETNHIAIAGEHDLAAAGKLDASCLDPEASAVSAWTAQQLTTADVLYLEELPTVLEEGDFTMVHGTLREPLREAIATTSIAKEGFGALRTRFCLAGHAHMPFIFAENEDGSCSSAAFTTSIGLMLGRSRLIINPGSVGQPRDGNPLASYAIYDTDMGIMRLYRIRYDIRATQDRLAARGLPMRLVASLALGRDTGITGGSSLLRQRRAPAP